MWALGGVQASQERNSERRERLCLLAWLTPHLAQALPRNTNLLWRDTVEQQKLFDPVAESDDVIHFGHQLVKRRVPQLHQLGHSQRGPHAARCADTTQDPSDTCWQTTYGQACWSVESMTVEHTSGTGPNVQ